MFFAFFFKKVIFADIRTWLLSSGRGGMKRMVYWDMMQDKGKIGKYYFVTHFPPLMNWCICFFFVDFISMDCWTCNVMSFFLLCLTPPPLPWAKLKTKHLLKKKCILEKKKTNKKCFACFAAPHVLCHRATLSICSLFFKKKGKDVSPMLTHKLLRWLICMNIEHVQVLYHYWFEDWLNIKSDYEDSVA